MSCICQVCGRKYKVDLNIEDSLWEIISCGKNLLCGSCIMRKIEELEKYNAFKLVEIGAQAPDTKSVGAKTKY